MTPSHWYDNASSEDLQEYNAFGPWLVEVTSENLLPRPFRQLWADWAGAEFLFKIPVNKDRRSTRPGAILYDRVIGFKGGMLGLFTLENGQIRTRTVAVADLAALRSSHVLLRGEFSFFLKGGEEVMFIYNAVSRPLVERLLDHLRSCLQTNLNPRDRPTSGTDVRDFAFQNLVRQHQTRRPGCRVAAFFEPDQPCRDSRKRRRKSAGVLFLDGVGETLVLDTGDSVYRIKEAVYLSRCTVLPHSLWEGFSLVGQSLEVKVGGTTFSWSLTGDTGALSAYLGQIPPIWSAPR